MSTETISPPPPATDAPIRAPYRFTAAQFGEIVRAGLFAGERVELLEGWIVPKMTTDLPHVIAAKLAYDLLLRLLPDGWDVVHESPLAASTGSVPEPDIMIIRGRVADYPDQPPAPADIALVIEVADSSLTDDRRRKAAIYARAGVAAYWIVNLVDRVVEAHDGPSGPGDAPAYARRTVVAAGGSLALVLDGNEAARVAVGDLLP